MNIARVSHPTKRIKTRIGIPGSKSESNRLLILNALSGNQLELSNLSTARDTETMRKILASFEKEVDVRDAGTAMRFLTAYFAATNQHKIITGTERMNQRPIAPLVNALSEMGFDIRYVGQEGYPPLEIVPIKSLERLENETHIEGNISSQFITALLLIAATLPNGLKINFTTELTSRPYVEMTLKLLEHFGIRAEWKDNTITIQHSAFQTQHYKVGGDWSSASYWYSIAFLADEAEIFLEGLKDDWTQGDQAIVDWMKRFGVTTSFQEEGALIQKRAVNFPKMMKMSFRDNPDLAQTIAVMFAAKDIYATFSGLETLRVKETDRVAALQNELKKTSTLFDYSDRYDLHQLKGIFQIPTAPIATYNDHRMAMSFAPLALMGEISIENPSVVEKSYPGFWTDLEKAGFVVVYQ
ncbi:MAG: 3-phosphoshikimate 1-carboxyvinyltransferase [Bacteroidetes bacterium]|nr:3-phosphoshikimate 1-carboxyvinyltransferase [Bacteroidota bacterium]